MSAGKGPAAVLIARHGERVDYVTRDAGGNWPRGAAEPWNPSLTEAGARQAQALGRAIVRHCGAHALPPVSRVYCSPLLRCLQTAAAACDGMNRSAESLPICVEPALVEKLSEHWYLSLIHI